MRILIVTHDYPPFGLAGVERVSEQSALALAARGHEVTVFTRRQSVAPPLPKSERSERLGIDVVCVTGGGSAHGLSAELASRLEAVFERELLALRPDVVLMIHLRKHSPGYVELAQRWSTPVVIELHDFFAVCERAHLQRRDGRPCEGPDEGAACARHCFPEAEEGIERFALRTQQHRSALQHADALIAPSALVASYFERHLEPTSPIHVIGSAVSFVPEKHQVAPPDGPLNLAVVGYLTAHKGAHLVLEALRMARLPKVRLTCFGAATQPYAQELRERAAEVENLQYRAYGAFDPAELPLLLRDTHLLVVPSLVAESYSLAAHEAVALGIPVVAASVGALPELIRNRENGILFEPGSARELKAVLQMLDSDRSELARLSSGIKRTDWVSAEARVRQLEAVLAAALGKRRTAEQMRGHRDLPPRSVRMSAAC